METERFTTVILRAEAGKYLTQAKEVGIMARAVTQTVALGRGDSAENWVEISAEQAEAYRRQQAAERERLKAERKIEKS